MAKNICGAKQRDLHPFRRIIEAVRLDNWLLQWRFALA